MLCVVMCALQVFALNHDVPPASYLMVLMHGKLQRQLEDMRYVHFFLWVVVVWGCGYVNGKGCDMICDQMFCILLVNACGFSLHSRHTVFCVVTA
jgi:hypothetical protein